MEEQPKCVRGSGTTSWRLVRLGRKKAADQCGGQACTLVLAAMGDSREGLVAGAQEALYLVQDEEQQLAQVCLESVCVPSQVRCGGQRDDVQGAAGRARLQTDAGV